MKHLKLYEETKFKSDIKEAYIGKYLRDNFFSSNKEPHYVSETYDKHDGVILYMIDMIFFDLDGVYFDEIALLKNYLVDNYELDPSDIGIYHRGCENEYENKLKILIRGIDNIERLEKEAKIYFDAKRYNI